MDILHFADGRLPRQLDTLTAMPATGLVWLDCVRETAQDWERTVTALTGVALEPDHVLDSLNARHPSFFDNTPAYDLLIFEDLGPRDDPFPLETRTAAFFLFDRLLVTVRAGDTVSIGRTRQKLADGRLKPPPNIVMLGYLVLNTMVDRYLDIRGPLAYRTTALQESLLDPDNPFNDWREVLNGRREVRRLESLCQAQTEALYAWDRGSRFEWSTSDEVHLRNLTEHIGRVQAATADVERDLEAAVQMHFAMVSYRTNEIVRILTVFSAIFLPLTFVVGIFGMNFEHMPELHWRFGYPLALGSMVLLAGMLLIFFRRRGYF
ncbi:MAG: magnesium transporter CorA family protein [Nevskiales bacterium]|nr:magnesium transporter CorA family protein [Nevskiales bacterium]